MNEEQEKELFAALSRLSPVARTKLRRSIQKELTLRLEARRKAKVGDYGVRYDFYGGNAEMQALREQEVMLSGPADTGKTIACLYLLNQLCWKHEGIQCAIIRKEYASLPGTALQSFQKKITKPEDHIRVYGGENRPDRFIYPNGSVIWVGGLDKASKALSSERDVIYVNQAEELLQTDWEVLITRANGRAGNVPFGMVYGDCNPAYPTHWIQSRAKSGSLHLLEVTHRDNPDIYDPVSGELTESGIRRIAALDALTGTTKKRLRFGIWTQPEGAIYDVFDEETHKVRDFPIPPTWPRIVGIDPTGAIIGALWLAWDADNQTLVVYREYYQPFGITTPEHARNILELSGYDASGRPLSSVSAEPIFAWVGGGPGERQQRTDWTAAGIPLLPNEIVEVWSQIDKVIQMLRANKLVVFESCSNLLNEIGSYRRKTVGGVVTDEIDHDENYHLLSCLRYVVAWLATPTEQVTLERLPMQQIGNY